MTSVPRWFPMVITQTDVVGGFTVHLTTNVPCHLWLYYTSQENWVHRKPVLDRGIMLPYDAYWCFVAWASLEQEEAGDTTIHTFNWLGWEHCQTKYFRFAGRIAGQDSPSDSPVFHKHYTAPVYFSVGGISPTTTGFGAKHTIINSENPCTGSGFITKLTTFVVQVPINDFKVGIFTQVAPNVFTTRSWASLWTLLAGGLHIITVDHSNNPLKLEIEPGDFIGYYYQTDVHGIGKLAGDYTVGPGRWHVFNADVIPCVSQLFGWYSPTDVYFLGESS